jgi:hypothetical protein
MQTVLRELEITSLIATASRTKCNQFVHWLLEPNMIKSLGPKCPAFPERQLAMSQ